MKNLIIAASFIAAATGQAAAGTNMAVPEMDVGAGVAAVALLVGAVAIMREKFTRK